MEGAEERRQIVGVGLAADRSARRRFVRWTGLSATGPSTSAVIEGIMILVAVAFILLTSVVLSSTRSSWRTWASGWHSVVASAVNGAVAVAVVLMRAACAA